jgi:response regulator RpfG family c-di-GMP phosphodiesterase
MINIVPDWFRRSVRAVAESMQGGETQPQTPAAKPAPGDGHPRARVLCVDDNLQVLRLLKRQLGTAYDLSIAQTAQDALALLAASEPFDVIVSDLRMPDVHGLTFLKKARELYPATERIILTGLPDPTTMSVARSAGGAEQLIVKPWSKRELVEAVENTVRRQRESGTEG